VIEQGTDGHMEDRAQDLSKCCEIDSYAQERAEATLSAASRAGYLDLVSLDYLKLCPIEGVHEQPAAPSSGKCQESSMVRSRE
jgi:hypothetical protein